MGGLMGASVLGTIAGIATFLGVFAANFALDLFELSFLRNGGGGFNLLWLGALPCLVAAVVAARISRADILRRILAAFVGTGGGTLATWIVFNLLAGLQGPNPLIFSGPFCAAIIAAALGMRSRKDAKGSF